MMDNNLGIMKPDFMVSTLDGSGESANEIDSLRAREMYKLSKTEREDVLHDLHGVSDVPCEKSHQEAMGILESCISEAVQEAGLSAEAYRQALRIDPSYISNTDFRMSFLRADGFDAKQAARRMIRFFDEKLKLFGPDLLCKNVTLSDLKEADLEILRSGQFQILSETDQAGRRILCNVRAYENINHPFNTLRAIFYMTMAAIEDESCQRKGVVQVVYNLGSGQSSSIWDTMLVVRATTLRAALPIRYVGIHYCVKDPALMECVNCEVRCLNASTRARCRIHKVSAMEAQYALASFGIQKKFLPITIRGKVKTEGHDEWMKSRLFAEVSMSIPLPELEPVPLPVPLSNDRIAIPFNANENTALPVTVSLNDSCAEPRSAFSSQLMTDSTTGISPTCHDVLFGRGKVKEHPGNILLHELIAERRARYELSEKWQKTVIAEEIVAIIRERSGRFLKQEKGDKTSWIPVDTETAREKVSHTFRSGRPKAGPAFATARKKNQVEWQNARSQKGLNGFVIPP